MIPHSDSQIWNTTNNLLHYRTPVFRSALKSYLSFTIYILKVRVIISFFTHSNFLFVGAKWRKLRYSIAPYGLPARRPCHLKTCLSRHQFFCSVMFVQDFTKSKRINKINQQKTITKATTTTNRNWERKKRVPFILTHVHVDTFLQELCIILTHSDEISDRRRKTS